MAFKNLWAHTPCGLLSRFPSRGWTRKRVRPRVCQNPHQSPGTLGRGYPGCTPTQRTPRPPAPLTAEGSRFTLGAFQAPVLVCSSLGKDKQSTAKRQYGRAGWAGAQHLGPECLDSNLSSPLIRSGSLSGFLN